MYKITFRTGLGPLRVSTLSSLSFRGSARNLVWGPVPSPSMGRLYRDTNIVGVIRESYLDYRHRAHV